MTAGPNAFRGSGPKSKARIRRCADPSGLSRSSGVQPLLHYVLVPLPTRMAVGIRIDPDCGNFDHGRLPSLVRFNATTLWHLDAESGRRPQHQKRTCERPSGMSAFPSRVDMLRTSVSEPSLYRQGLEPATLW